MSLPFDRLLLESLADEFGHIQESLQQALAARAAVGAVPEHEWDGTKLRFRNPDGTWGPWVDLQGPPGKPGRGGGGGGGGGGSPGQSLSFLLPASNDLPSHFAVEQDGVWRKATLAQMRTWLGSGGVTGSGAVVTVNGEVVTVS